MRPGIKLFPWKTFSLWVWFNSAYLAKLYTRSYKKDKEKTQTLVISSRQIISRWSASLIINLWITLMHWSWVLDLVLWDHSLDVWSSWSCSSIKSLQPSADLFTCSWMKTVSQNTNMPVWMACLDNMLKWRHYQLGLLASKHYILKMNSTNSPFLIMTN